MAKIITLSCMFCHEKVAKIDLEKLSLPLTGDQFMPAGKGYPDPFPKDAYYNGMFCRRCGRRPFGFAKAPQFVVGRDTLTYDMLMKLKDNMPETVEEKEKPKQAGSGRGGKTEKDARDD